MLGRTRQVDRSQIDALIRHGGLQIEAVDTGYLRETETLGRSRIRARLILHRPNPAIAKTRNLSQYGANSEALSTPTEPSMAQKDAVNAEEHPQRYTSTGIFECVSTLTVSLPRTTAETPRRPCEAITIKSHPLAEAASMIA